MKFFPFRRTRAESDEFLRQLILRAAEGELAFQAVELRATGECIGFCGLNRVNVEPFLPTDTIEIGWRFACRFWGYGYATEAASRWLEHGFSALGLPEIVSYAVRENQRSTAVMERLGMIRNTASDFDHPRVPDSHPHLKRHVVYRIARNDWGRKKGGF